MIVRFWGAKGSLPSSMNSENVRGRIKSALELALAKGLSDVGEIDAFIDKQLPFGLRGTYGTNTPCVEIRDGDDVILCDAGTGLRDFGNHALKSRDGKPDHYHILMSHFHWDHMQGFPFFAPGLIPGNRITIYSCHEGAAEAFAIQHSAPFFPIDFKDLRAEVAFVRLYPGETREISGFQVTPKSQVHPGISYGYRLQKGGKSVVYSTDSEHRGDKAAQDFITFFDGADFLIFDAQYTLADAWTAKMDWGHSSNLIGVELAQKAGVKHLCLFHSDPVSTDETLDKVLADTKRLALLMDEGGPLEVSVAYDGLVVELSQVSGGKMEIDISKENEAVLVTVKGRMDAVTSPDFQENLEGLVANGERRIVVDCQGLEYISSAGLRSILIISKSLKNEQGELALFGLNDMVREVFEISGFSTVIPIHESRDGALGGKA
ncbi:MAG: anti-sigma factor antagonist [Deltaproteobacteria bacterium]|nr:anti-sigma factor antagonist [Deltaproteobacteria bacterium]